ncbi:MAG: SRPBCC family protein [Bdellovibrionota bacterium]
MSAQKTTTGVEGRDLLLSRVIDAAPEKVYRAWTDPNLLKQWFAPKPYLTTVVENEVRAGGSSMVVMRSPEGQEIPCPGVYLEVEENKRLVFTDAFVRAWEPSEKPFMTVVVTFDDLGGKTKYTARVRHWSVADREAHEKMGFHEGWAVCAEQLASLVEAL